MRSSGTYTFTYNSDPIPHLTSIANNIGTGEKFTFSYGSQTLNAPFWNDIHSGDGHDSVFGRGHYARHDAQLQLRFLRESSRRSISPYGGYLKYDYTTTTYATALGYREVAHRYLSKDGTTGSQVTYPLAHESSPSSYNTHYSSPYHRRSERQR